MKNRSEKNKAYLFDPEITEWDLNQFNDLTTLNLSDKQKDIIIDPPKNYPFEKDIMAIHWHPESAPIDLVKQRINNLFPNKETELIIPTQHNIIMAYGDYSGVEVDCFAKEFNRKVQLLLHFKSINSTKTSKIKDMLKYTFKYRSSQLFELIDSFIDEKWALRTKESAIETGSDQTIVDFLTTTAQKLKKMIEDNYSKVPEVAIKNKLFRNYINAFQEHADLSFINRAQVLLKKVKKSVKMNFSKKFFFNVHEVIEETRSLNGGIIIPHPEQFWPILLADYDVDGYEVWNPQSRDFTEFLVQAVENRNQRLINNQKPFLVFMGDDTHFDEKIKTNQVIDQEKASREIGVQPAWNDLAIKKALIKANSSKQKSMLEYRERLS